MIGPTPVRSLRREQSYSIRPTRLGDIPERLFTGPKALITDKRLGHHPTTRTLSRYTHS
jgi:hypothetical protein